MKRKLSNVFRSASPILAILAFLLTTAASSAGTLTASLLDEETDIVNTGGALVSAANFGDNADPGQATTAVTVNGLFHGKGVAAGANLTHNFSSPGFEGNFRTNALGLPAGPLRTLLGGIAGANGITMSISGLAIGQQYLFQTYWEGNAGQTLTITMEGDNLSLVPDQVPAVLISYQFTATDTTLNIFIDRDDALGGDPNNWLSGYSLQVAAPTGVPPVLTGKAPPDDATGVITSANLVATFDKTVQAPSVGTGSIRIFKSDDTLVEALDVNDTTAPGTVAFTGSVVTVDPSNPLLAGGSYYVLIDSTAITDTVGSPFAGIADKTAWNFTVSASVPVLQVGLLDEETDIVNTGGTLVSAANFGDNADPGQATTAVTVNGLFHGKGVATGANLSINSAGEGAFRAGGSGLPAGPLQVLLGGIAYANGITMAIGNLTVGTEYLFQTYWEGNPGQTLTVTMEGDNLTLVPDQVPAVLISYRFTATDDTLNVTIDRDDALAGDVNNWLSGYSLQTTSPVVGATYAGWQSANLTAGTINEDHDGDGVPNGIEYFLGGNASTTGFTALPGMDKALDGTFSVTWTKATAYIGTYGPAADFVVETSETLTGTWTAETLAPSGDVTITGSEVKYTFPSPLSAKKFARLRVTGP